MSFDEKQNLVDDSIEISRVVKLIWFYKYSLLITLILSVPVSVTIATKIEPKFKAETVFEKPNVNSDGRSSLLSDFSGGTFMSLLGGVRNDSAENFYSVIRSDSFLKTVFMGNASLDNKTFRELCALPSGSIPPISLKSLLVTLGLSKIESPNEPQKISLLAKCLNEMFEIESDSHNGMSTGAFKLSVTSKNPIFSANLANEIVEKYFIWHEQSRDSNFQSIKKYLSKVISESQLEFTEASGTLQNFMIKHTRLMNISPLANGLGMDTPQNIASQSPFKPELNREIANLSQLEKSKSQLKQAKVILSSLKDADQDKIKEFLTSTQLQGVLSRTFITSISKIDEVSTASTFNNKYIKKIMIDEIKSLEQQITIVENKLGDKEGKALKLMDIENRFQELVIDVQKKQIIFEGLKDQLKEKILATGLESVGKPILLTKAVAPIGSVSPNKKLIVVLFAMLSMVLVIAYVLISQLFLKRLYSKSQLKSLAQHLSCYQIKLKQIKSLRHRADETVISQSVFSNIKEKGRLGCIIDLSKKTRNASHVQSFSKVFANLLASDNTKVVRLNILLRHKSLSANVEKNFTFESKKPDDQGVSFDSVEMFKDQESVIGTKEVIEIREKYSDYDKVMCLLGSEVGDLTKFSFIEKCDFYILIARSFMTDEHNFKKFANSVWEKEKKCLGFFLID